MISVPGRRFSPKRCCINFINRFSKNWKRVKNADVKIMCILRSNRALLDDLIEAVWTLSIRAVSSAGWIHPAKSQYGRGFAFGAAAVHRANFAQSTPAEVAEHVRQQVAVMRQGSGFVFQQVHNVMADVRPENIVAMFRAVNT
jgi:uroporphyrinogen decarboxylase